MASGITFDMITFSRQQRWRSHSIEDRAARPRNRSLAGKKRIRARKAANKTVTV